MNIQHTEARASFTADISLLVDEIGRMPKNGSGSTEDYRPVATAFMAAVDHHRDNGMLEADPEAAMTLWNCGFSLITTLDDTHGVDATLLEGVWNCYEALSGKVGIDLAQIHAEALERNGEQS